MSNKKSPWWNPESWDDDFYSFILLLVVTYVVFGCAFLIEWIYAQAAIIVLYFPISWFYGWMMEVGGTSKEKRRFFIQLTIADIVVLSPLIYLFFSKYLSA
ncbi:hypothetical protein EON83_19585 [bacterium]|nr:MAG: hypothetical protein EON83_19585 [bacterium]